MIVDAGFSFAMAPPARCVPPARLIGRYGTARQDIQVGTDVGMLDHVEQVDMFRIAQVIGDTFGTAAQVEHLVQTGLADVHTDNQGFLCRGRPD